LLDFAMFPKATLVSFLMVALSLTGVSATPLVSDSKMSLAIATKIKATGSVNIVAADQARAKALKESGLARAQAKAAGNTKRASSFPVTNSAVCIHCL
jgi:hypothetical protein